ncbi:hypothetical protein E2320_006277 [Naja naja]|nr:hypothetical protein E2320_006277 [Naja naja]
MPQALPQGAPQKGFMQQFYNETYQGRYSKYMDEGLMTALWSLSVSFFPLGGFFGSLMVGPMVNNCGRKGTLLINNIFSIIPAILMGISKVAKTFEVIIICRIVIGICAGSDDVEEEMDEMRQEDQAEKAEGRMSVLTLFTYPGLRWQLISIIVMMMGQQLSGVNAVYYYADRIYSNAGIEESHVQFVTVGTGAVFVVEALGRRILLLAGFGVCCVACAVLTIALNLKQGLGPYCFLIFGAVCLATAVYVFLIVPETKNKTFMEINQIMAKRNGTEDPAEKDELKDFTAVSVPYSKKMDGRETARCKVLATFRIFPV